MFRYLFTFTLVSMSSACLPGLGGGGCGAPPPCGGCGGGGGLSLPSLSLPSFGGSSCGGGCTPPVGCGAGSGLPPPPPPPPVSGCGGGSAIASPTTGGGCGGGPAYSQPSPNFAGPAPLGPLPPPPPVPLAPSPSGGYAVPPALPQFNAAPAPAQFGPAPAQYGSPQPVPTQYAPAQLAPAQYGPAQQAPAQYGSAQQAPAQYGPAQQAPAQYGPAQPAPAQYAPAQFAPAQYGSSQPAPPQYGPAAAQNAPSTAVNQIDNLLAGPTNPNDPNAPATHIAEGAGAAESTGEGGSSFNPTFDAQVGPLPKDVPGWVDPNLSKATVIQQQEVQPSILSQSYQLYQPPPPGSIIVPSPVNYGNGAGAVVQVPPYAPIPAFVQQQIAAAAPPGAYVVRGAGRK